MKKIIIMTIIAVLLVLGIVCSLCFIKQVPKVNNVKPVEAYDLRDNGLEKLLLAEAIFEVRCGFEDVSIYDLADEVQIDLECKRQTGDDRFYYVVTGDGYRGFLFTDAKNITQAVIVTRFFPSTKEVREEIAELEQFSHITIEQKYQNLSKGGNMQAGGAHYILPLEDGVLVMHKAFPLTKDAECEYFFYSEEDWPAAAVQWLDEHPDMEIFSILPMDKVRWN